MSNPPPSPENNVGVEAGQKTKQVEGPTKHMSPQHCFWGEGGGLGHSDKKRVGQQTEVMFVAGWYAWKFKDLEIPLLGKLEIIQTC